MQKIIPILSVTLISILIFSFEKTDNTEKINPVIGDISFIKKFGCLPDKNTNEDVRIKAHLEFAESLLRKKNVSNLPAVLKKTRFQLLNLLHNYWTAGIFPRNYDYTNRKPCFIDRDNRICAVGYLIEKTAGRKTAGQINTRYKYDEILAMKDKDVDTWIANSGLTKEECAMIQPTYGPAPVYSYNQIPAAYGISSSALGGINLSLNVVNAIQMMKGTNSKSIPSIGLITGAGQVVLGIAAFPKNVSNFNRNTTNESKKILSMANIGIGTSTMLLSAWNLITRKKMKDKNTAWNVYTLPTANKVSVGVGFTRKI